MAKRREQRVLLAEAQAAAPTVVMAEPEQILLSSLHDANATLQAIKAQLSELTASAGAVSPAMLGLIGDWLDRVARISKIIVDGEIAERLEKRLGWAARDRADMMWGMLAAMLKAAPLTAADRLLLWNIVGAAARLVADGVEPLRLSRDEVHRFTAELQTAAVREREAAEGFA